MTTVAEHCPRCRKECPPPGPLAHLVTCDACNVQFVSVGATQISLHSRRASGKERVTSVISITPEFAARYKLGAVLGTGAMGQVFESTQVSTGRSVAVKFLTRLGEPEILSRFIQEGRVLARMTHENVVRVLDSDELQSHPYLVTELLEGGTLRARLRFQGRLPIPEAIQIARECLAALCACHATGVIHRDVKPENVMFGSDGHARLVDFGIAKAYGEATHTTRAGVMIGTPRYMPPELIRGMPATLACDIYSLGCVLYEMITGRPPFNMHALAELVPNIMNQPPPPMSDTVPEVPVWLEDLVARALAKAIPDRPASAQEFVEALEAGMLGLVSADDLAPAGEEPVEAVEEVPEDLPANDTLAGVAEGERPVGDTLAGEDEPHINDTVELTFAPHPEDEPVAIPIALAEVPAASGARPGWLVALAVALGLLLLAAARAFSQVPPERPVVTIDPGHPSEVADGATRLHGTTEVHEAWEVSLRLARLLEAAGMAVVLTKDRERQLVKNRERAEIANRSGAALMVRLHTDAASGSGYALYHPDRKGRTQGVTGPDESVIRESGRAAHLLHQGMAAELAGQLVDGGVRGDSKTFVGGKQGALTGSIFSRVPVVTIEMVVLTNASDAAWIRSPSGKDRMAAAIARGVLTYLNAPPGARPPPGTDAPASPASAYRGAPRSKAASSTSRTPSPRSSP